MKTIHKTESDVLGAIRSELYNALENGLTERQFIQALEPRLHKLLWQDNKTMGQPDSIKHLVQLESPHCLKTIFQTNMASAYNARRYKQMKEIAINSLLPRPNWQYVAVIDQRTRHSHRALHSKVFRHDDPFWDTFYPPNGWNCRCRVTALTADEVSEKGLCVEKSDKDFISFRQKVIVNKDTDKVIEIDAVRYRGRDATGKPFTITPDAGFGYNPGKEQGWWDCLDDDNLLLLPGDLLANTLKGHGLSDVPGHQRKLWQKLWFWIKPRT